MYFTNQFTLPVPSVFNEKNPLADQPAYKSLYLRLAPYMGICTVTSGILLPQVYYFFILVYYFFLLVILLLSAGFYILSGEWRMYIVLVIILNTEHLAFS